MIINVVLAHRNSTLFFKQQVKLIQKFFKYNKDSELKIYGFVDADKPKDIIKMMNAWDELNVEHIIIPNIIDNVNRSSVSSSVSFGLAANYVYKEYIKNNDSDIFILMENDVFPFKEINIEEYVKDYEMCGEIRFNPATLPERFTHFWLGFLIFNKKIMTDSDLFGCRCLENMPGIITDKTYWVDCGAESYYWLNSKKRKIKILKTNGSGGDDYDPFTSETCIIHNIKDDIENLPEILRKNYCANFGVLIYDDCLIHLENMGKLSAKRKLHWWKYLCLELI